MMDALTRGSDIDAFATVRREWPIMVSCIKAVLQLAIQMIRWGGLTDAAIRSLSTLAGSGRGLFSYKNGGDVSGFSLSS